MATISQKEWKRYIARLREINDKAADEFRQFIVDKGGYGNIDRQKLIDYAYGISTKYGEASAALSAQMYDAIAELSGAPVAAAMPAETASYQEVAKTVNGIIKKTESQDVLTQGIGRLVKMAGTDTILSNAYRDRPKGKGSKRRHSGAQVAWIPSGDTCAYCLMLASKGWQNQTEWGANNHTEHIHANCDCTYAVRFDDKFDVEGYYPEKIQEYYENSGDNRKERLKTMRHDQYVDNKDKINAQKREAYRNKKIQDAIGSIKGQDVTFDYIKSSKPGIGNIIAEEGFKNVNGEKETAQWLKKTFGGHISLLADDHPEGEPNPDYLWNGKLWDLKSPNTSNKNTIDKRIQHGIKQIQDNTGGVIVDLSKSELDFADSIKVVDEFANKRAKTTTDFIVKKGNEFKVIRVKK